MKVVFAASEGVPYCKTGGLADVVGALSKTLSQKGHQVLVFLPLYKEISKPSLSLQKIGRFKVSGIEKKAILFSAFQTRVSQKFKAIFIDCPRLFNRKGLYGYKSGEEFDDNHIRFSFFSKAVLETLKRISFKPDIIHCHDWQTGMIPTYLNDASRGESFFKNTATVFSIHNMAYQGLFKHHATKEILSFLRPSSKKTLLFGSHVSFLKAGLLNATMLNTVSPTYRKEISSLKEFGCGLEPVLRKRKKMFYGILNGLDVAVWNPRSDSFLKKNFSIGENTKRAACKRGLQKRLGFPLKPESPLFGFVGRLDVQKGIEILIKLVPGLVSKGCQFVFLGQGNPKYRKQLKELQKKYRKSVFVENKFAEPLAHQIYAGSDIFLMPSQYEPCGLGQMIAMRYGSIPIVMPTGGLLDTVVDASKPKGTGYVSSKRNFESFRKTVLRAIREFNDKKKWLSIQKRAMKQDFSWTRSMREYVRLYEKAISWKKRK